MNPKNSAKFALSISITLMLLVLLSACDQKQNAGPTVNFAQVKFLPRGDYFKTTFQSESEFIVQAIASDIAEMAIFAKDHTAPATGDQLVTIQEYDLAPANMPKYKLEIKLPWHKLEYDLQINPAYGTIWSPETYAGLTREIFNSLGLKETPLRAGQSNDLALPAALLDLTPGIIVSENTHLSRDLLNNFTDPSLHEKAALLVGAFALRENSGYFFEIRSPLCRMTARLAVARGFSGDSPAGLNGRIAEALLYTLMNNEKQALAKTGLIGQEQPVLTAWTRALTARNTLDYRPLGAVENRSLLETIEYFRAFCGAVDADLAWDKLTKTQQSGTADFCRIINARRGGVSVELGHATLAYSLPLEIKEATVVLQLPAGNKNMKPMDFINALNTMPERCVGVDDHGAPTIQVVGRGQWATFCQRHLCQALVADYNFILNRWGVKEYAREFSDKSDGMFSDLRFYPFVRKKNCRDEQSYRSAVDDSLKVVRATPQIVPAEIWNEVYYQVPFAARYRPDSNTRVDEWHSHNPPPGTAYNPYPRFDHSNLVRCPDSASRVQQLYELSPYDLNIQYCYLYQKYGDRATYAQAEEIYRPVLDYSGSQLYMLAEKAKGDPEVYLAAMTKAAAFVPRYNFTIAEFLLKSGGEDEAIPYIQKGMDLDADDVTKSSYADIMIRYYVKQGQIGKASALADFAADTVYSAKGLEAKARFLESQGKYQDALEYYKKIEERYERSEPVISFCQRYKKQTGKNDFDEILAHRISSLFHHGMQKVTLVNFMAPPRDGVIVGAENRETKKVGLNQGSVIVALDGIQIHNFDQYKYVRGLTNAPEICLIVWQNNGYHEIKATPPKRIFGVDMPDYFPN